nr:hypothetical protein [Kibdelosporangium sp. MJ126-NF4]CTQ95470.1 hypothetical protein [Kibdelosporangium sp. MJ126-NF4]
MHVLLVVLSLMCLFLGFIWAALDDGAPGMLLWTLALPVIGVLIAIVDRQWVALVPHGSMIALNLVVILPL